MAQIQQQELAEMLAAYMRSKKMVVSEDPNTYNTVYVEGCNADGTPNADAPNLWNDRCMVYGKVDGHWTMLHNVKATTEPGKFYTDNPMNAKGAARIAFGQYEAWRPGKHQGIWPALIQVRPVKVHRDLNKNYIRDKKDKIEDGLFDLNQHSTSRTFAGRLVGKFSAGCLVTWKYQEHQQFLGLMYKDVRFLDSPKSFIYRAALIAGDKFYKHFHSSSGR